MSAYGSWRPKGRERKRTLPYDPRYRCGPTATRLDRILDLEGQGAMSLSGRLLAAVPMRSESADQILASMDVLESATRVAINELAGNRGAEANTRRPLTIPLVSLTAALAVLGVPVSRFDQLIASNSPDVIAHSRRVAVDSLALAMAIGMDWADLPSLYIGALLHDIGKTALPPDLLSSRRDFTAGELRTVQQHTICGEAICERAGLPLSVRQVVRHHHERLDGSGYPDGLCGNAVPLAAQIVSIADAFDAMTSDRPHRGARSTNDAIRELRLETRTGWRDTVLVETFSVLHSTDSASHRGDARDSRPPLVPLYIASEERASGDGGRFSG